MSNENWTPREKAQEEELLATYIAEQVIGRASGRLEKECLFNLPQDCYFIGSLRSAVGENGTNDNRLPFDLRNKLAPTTFGAEFLAYPKDGVLQIEVSVQWACYYRIFPTYTQQWDFQHVDETTDEQSAAEPRVVKVDDAAENVEPEDDVERTARWELERERQQARDERLQQQPTQDTLCPRFRKIPCQAIGNLLLREGTDGKWEIDKTELERALDAEVNRSQQVVFEDNERLRSNSENLDRQINVSNAALNSESVYNHFKEQLKNEIPLLWKWDIQVECQDSQNVSGGERSDSRLVSINFTNVSSMPDRSMTRENFFLILQQGFCLQRGMSPHSRWNLLRVDFVMIAIFGDEDSTVQLK